MGLGECQAPSRAEALGKLTSLLSESSTVSSSDPQGGTWRHLITMADFTDR